MEPVEKECPYCDRIISDPEYYEMHIKKCAADKIKIEGDRMKPSKEAIAKFSPLFGQNTQMIAECFSHLIKSGKKVDQASIDAMFMVFCTGIAEPMIPGSYFNTHWKVELVKD